MSTMLAVRVSHLPALVSSIGKSGLSHGSKFKLFTQVQTYASEARSSRFLKRKTETRTLKETLTAPGGETAISMGRGLVAGASVLGLGALCYYGLGMSKEVGALEKSVLWSPEVRRRMRDTYMYFAASVGVTAAAAVAASRSPRLMSLMTRRPLLFLFGSYVAMIGSGSVCHSIPYKSGFGAKQLAWLAHAGILGAVVAPITFLGGPILVRAAWYTVGVIGGLSTIAMCAPSEKFLNMAGPLACGLGVVLVSSIGTFFLPATSVLGASLYSISVYGGLVLFSMFLLYDTQKIIKKAETHPAYALTPYDPINASTGIFLDTLNIFIRIAYILAGNRRK
ncbi:hypothetical protein CHS0354_007325 [Potamilus streckersoni]|uniref:Growth hormone-inducible transmembrane protein n=1 Tax=Potamilus streckersoni TaxID=2493646 RepID=A0AAE0TDM3_9BIVA|nr:hypothetical protein CHS0354_007325 [Potamilus streckersoni]